MYRHFQRRLVEHVRSFLKQKHQLELETIVVEQPPSLDLGEFALPFAFELARKLRKAPRKIAEEIVAEMPHLEGFGNFDVAGGGYINVGVDRGAAASMVLSGAPEDAAGEAERILVEHTSINPNKAAHIGHLRNAILGDTFVRLLRAGRRQVAVQNYIDNTGVQVADVVVGFVHLEKKSKAEIAVLIAGDAKFDYYCWDLYARVSQWYAADKANKGARLDTLHAIEQGGNELAEIAEMISTAVLRRHLETMDRLGIEYDFLPRESEILHLHFWAAAFEVLKQKKVLYFEEHGKNKGCWVMTRPGAAEREGDGPDEDAKVIVRSNGTVGYVGKDIAYHLWKFGLLGRDFGYRRFYRYPNGNDVWISAEQGEAEHPHFGGVAATYNVIDARQSEPQETVKEAIRLLGHEEMAARFTHFSYEMVALTPRCAMELGYQVSPEDQQKAHLEVSGRKGFGVKADDLIDKLIAAAQAEVDKRHARDESADEEDADLPSIDAAERQRIATQIAVGALRYFMLKFTRPTVIAFDFREALKFEGETGPYLQYAVARINNIFRKGGTTAEAVLKDAAGKSFGEHLSGEAGTEIWGLWLRAGQTSQVVEQSIATSEPAYIAKHAFQLAQEFSSFYRNHKILREPDAGRKLFLLATAAMVRRELMRVLDVMGIGSPQVM